MARKANFNLPGVPQLIIQKASNQDPCFFVDKDYLAYLDILKDAAETFNCHIHAYVLMSNHVHLLVTPYSDSGVTQLIQTVNRQYTAHIGRTYGRTDPLWAGNYHSCPVDINEYLLDVMRYIELNPVRSEQVEYPGDYRWSSYHRNALHKPDDVVHPHPSYMELAKSEIERAQRYQALCELPLSVVRLEEIRTAQYDEQVLGHDAFRDKIREVTERARTEEVCVECVMYY